MRSVLAAFIITFICSSNGAWTSHSGLPYADSSMVIGYDSYESGDYIHILGGEDHPREVTWFNIHTETFSASNESQMQYSLTLPRDTTAYCSSYAQIGHDLYMIDRTNSHINVYTMNKHQFNFNITTMLYPASIRACLTVSSTHVFVIGGIGPMGLTSLATYTYVQIYEISSKTWTEGPHMNTARTHLSCIVHPNDENVVFAIGGYNNNVFLDTIEKIDVAQNKATYLDGSLAKGLGQTRAITYDSDGMVYILGGKHSFVNDNDEYVSHVHVLNPITEEIQLGGIHFLPYGVSGPAAIIVQNKMYAFGGTNQSGKLKKWMKYQFFTMSPTNEPSQDPSPAPTGAPSVMPSQFPTVDPTAFPTSIPTKFPSKAPTRRPTSEGKIMEGTQASTTENIADTPDKDTTSSGGSLYDLDYEIQMVIIAAIALFFCCLSLVCCFCYRRERKRAQTAESKISVSKKKSVSVPDLKRPLSGDNNVVDIEMMMNQKVDLEVINNDIKEEDDEKKNDVLEIETTPKQKMKPLVPQPGDSMRVVTSIVSEDDDSDGMYDKEHQTPQISVGTSSGKPLFPHNDSNDGMYAQENRIKTIEGNPLPPGTWTTDDGQL